jgi:hypothetical protein
MKRFALLGATLLGLVALSTGVFAQGTLTFKAEMTAAEEVATPPVVSAATGVVRLMANQERTQIAFDLDIRNATNIFGAAGAHLHCGVRGQNGPIVVFLAGMFPGGLDGRVEGKGVLTQDNIQTNTCSPAITTIGALIDAMVAGRIYANAHSPAFPAGEIRGQVED